MHREIDPCIFICSHGGKRKRSCFTHVEVPILMGSPEGLGIYPWVAFPQGKEILVLFLYVLVSHQGKKKRSCLYVCGEIGLLMGSLEDWEQHQVVFSQENPLVREPPLQHNLLWPTLSGGNIIGLGGN